MHDRVIRFLPRFQSNAHAVRYALVEGRRMALQNQMA
jgi:hypothetical protein